MGKWQVADFKVTTAIR